jgi:hypothetical protein
LGVLIGTLIGVMIRTPVEIGRPGASMSILDANPAQLGVKSRIIAFARTQPQ